MDYDLSEIFANLSAPSDTLVVNSSVTTIFIGTALGILIVCTLFGNLFVIYAILADRVLRRVGNYLVLSLAIADSLVACTVMPISAFYDVTGEWRLGSVLCEIWTSADVLCCTASILHLLAIALDRYWAVTHVDYIHQRDNALVGKMIAAVWLAAILISFAPILGWKDPDFMKRIQQDKVCLVSQDIAYQIFATCSSFYAPLVVILFLYWRIYKVAKRRIRHKPGSANVPATGNSTHRDGTLNASEISIRCDDRNGDPSISKSVAEPEDDSQNGSTTMAEKQTSSSLKCSINHRPVGTSSEGSTKGNPSPVLMKESIEAKRERKAAKTLAIITGAFVICWLPFFIVAILRPICADDCNPPKLFQSIISWLGFTNSTLNPIIYTIFSPEFRAAFQRILCGRKLPSRGPCYV